MNKVFLIGRTTREIDFRKTATGKSVVAFTLAIDNRFVLKDGKPTTDFINCVAWNKTAETMDRYVKKGMLIAIEGRIQTRNYENKEGNTIYVTEIIVENLTLIEYKKKEDNDNQYSINDDQYDISMDDISF